jgi:hypothetical protein
MYTLRRANMNLILVGKERRRFEIFTEVTMTNVVFRDVMSRGSCKNRRFGRHVIPKRRFNRQPHCVIGSNDSHNPSHPKRRHCSKKQELQRRELYSIIPQCAVFCWQNLRFSQWWLWGILSSRIYSCVNNWKSLFQRKLQAQSLWLWKRPNSI